MKQNELKERWGGKGLLQHCQGNALVASPFGKTEFGWDYRGITELGSRDVVNLAISDCDMRGADLAQCWVENNRFVDVDFSQATLTGIREHNNIFRDCVFESTKLNESGLGYKASEYRECRFSKCNFKKAVFCCGAFDRCLFNGCNLSGVDFGGSSFARCKFVGILSTVWFRGRESAPAMMKACGHDRRNGMEEVDFSEAIFRDVTFSDDCPLSTVKKPSSEMTCYFSEWRNLLLGLLPRVELMDVQDQDDARISIEAFLYHAENQNEYIVNFEDLETGSRAPSGFGVRMRKLFLEAYSSLKGTA